MLPLETPIIDIEYNTGELVPELTDVLRNTIVDVRCTAKDGRQFLVEMQLFWYDSFTKRVLFNASKAYTMQLEVSKKFKTLKPVYSLNFINENFDMSPEKKNEYYHHYKIVNIKETKKQIEGLEFVFLELPKFKAQNRAEKKMHELWLRFLTEVDEKTKEIPPEFLKDELICEAVGYMEKAAYTKEQLAAYDKYKIDVMSAQSMIDDAEEKGIEKGIAKGIAQRETEIAKNMLKNGVSIEIVSNCTGLSIQQVKEIQNNLEK
jgi:predicted transposase/invertase (TIGR01784 family)